MSTIHPTLPKLAVRDSFDDEDLTDVDDEVFIRDGRNGMSKSDDDGGVKRPLMAPRRKYKNSYAFERHRLPYKVICLPMCYGFAALIILISLIVLCIFTVNSIPKSFAILKNWLPHESNVVLNTSNIVPCTSLSSQIVWTRSLPKLSSEAPLRSNDVNGDNIDDIIIGISTGLDIVNPSDYVCSAYFDNQMPCMGGVMALDGKTGETIWTHWTAHAIFSIDCELDITNDNTKDCVISGRGGVLHAINGRDGVSIWEMPIQDSSLSEQQRLLDIYDAKFIRDADSDGVGDVISSHTMQTGDVHSSEILIVSGKNGNIIHNVNLPETEQLFIVPQMLVHPDGENIFVLATSGQRQSGGLYIVPESNFYGNLKIHKIHYGSGKGVLLPPIFVDITLDGTEDIIVAMFNSSIVAYDGLKFVPLWNYTIPNSEVISIPIPGYYNDDNIPDFMIKHQIGAGFPTYYYTVATIIDGSSGKSLLEKPIEDSLSRQMSGLSITVDGFGNDWFLHWSADCLNYEGAEEKYQFLKGQSIVSEARADLCKLRFNSSLITHLFALSQHVGPPGVSLYYSEDWKSLEFNNSIDPRKEAEEFFIKHPPENVGNTYADPPLVSERSPRILHTNPHKGSIFRHKENNILPELDDNYPIKLPNPSYKDYKNSQPVDVEFEADNIDDLNTDDSWQRPNKWIDNNVMQNKDYDIYDNDNVNKMNDERNLDYSQNNEFREQRSDTNHNNKIQKKVLEKQFDSNMNYINNINRTVDNFNDEQNLREKREISNFNKTVEQHQQFAWANNDRESFQKSKQVNHAKPKNESSEIVNNTLPEPTVTSQVNYSESTDSFLSNEFFKISQNDADIELIFQKESLKNHEENLKSNSLVTDANQHNVKLRKKRTKRKIDNKNDEITRIKGIQKQPPTGILLSSISPSEKGRSSIDLVFSTFWLPSSEVSLVLLKEDLDCINRKKVLSENKVQYQKIDDIIKECLSERGVDYQIYQEAMDRENIKIPLGQMTVYRMKLECVCPEDMLPNQVCKNISKRQSWPEYLGSFGNGYFKPLRKT